MVSMWQCSRCWTTYSFDDFMKLDYVWVKEDEKERYGKEPLCAKCGCRFLSDKWQMETTIDNHYWVSTVHLSLGNFVDPSRVLEDLTPQKTLWFQTAIKDLVRDEWLSFQMRYSTEQEAKEGHEFTVKNINRILENPDKYPQDIFFQFFKATGAVPEGYEKNERREEKGH